MLVVASRAPVPCYADRVWPNPLHVVCGPTGGNVEEMVSTTELHQPCSVALDSILSSLSSANLADGFS